MFKLILTLAAALFLTSTVHAQNINEATSVSRLKSIQLVKASIERINQKYILEERVEEIDNLILNIRKYYSNIKNPENLFNLKFNDPILVDFRSMAEMEGYINSLDLKKLSHPLTCKQEALNLNSIARSMKDDLSVALPELYWAQNLVLAICK